MTATAEDGAASKDALALIVCMANNDSDGFRALADSYADDKPGWAKVVSALVVYAAIMVARTAHAEGKAPAQIIGELAGDVAVADRPGAGMYL